MTTPPRLTASASPGKPRLGGRFYRLLSASAAANIGDGIVQYALPVLAAVLTREPAQIAAVAFASRLPWLFFALPAGALADRLDRRRTMLIVQVARSLLLGGMAVVVAADLAAIWVLIAVAFLLGVLETLFDTAAQSILPSVVHRDQLSVANGRIKVVEWTAQQFIGPPLGGFIAGMAALGLVYTRLAWTIGASAVLFMVAASLLLTMRGSFRPERPAWATPRLGRDVAEGVRYLLGHRLLRTLGFMTGIQNLAFTAGFSVLVLYAFGPHSAMKLSEAGYGLLLAASGIGAIFGGVVTPPLERWLGRSNVLMVAVAGSSLSMLIPALTANPYAVGCGFTVGAALSVCWNVVTVSLRQRITPDHLLGRVNAGYRTLAWGAIPLGAALGGVLAEVVGLRWTFAIAAAITVVLLGLKPIVSDTNIAAAEANSAPTRIDGS